MATKKFLTIAVLFIVILSSTLIITNSPLASASASFTTYSITLSGVPTGTGTYQQLITLDPATYTINSQGSNILFYASNGTELYAWLESINSTSALYWIKSYEGSSTINMYVYPSTNNFFSSIGYLGEAPQLSSTYAEYDNGVKVFINYWNFIGSSLPSGWTIPSGSNYTVNNGFIGKPSAGSTTAVYDSSIQETSSIIVEWGINLSSTSYPDSANLFQLNRYSSSSFMHWLGVQGADTVLGSIGTLKYIASSGVHTFGIWNGGTTANGYYNDQIILSQTVTAVTDYLSLGWTTNSLSYNFPTIYYVRDRVYVSSMPTYSISSGKSYYSVTFTESGLPSGVKWFANVSGQASQNSTSSSIILTNSLSNGTYTYSISSTNPEYVPTVSSASFTVNGANIDVSVVFIEHLTVTFTESGLPSGVKWFANVSGQASQNSITSTIAYSLINGTYSYTVQYWNTTYFVNPSSGTFTINGVNIQINVTFSLGSFKVTFTESGLPSSTMWYANVTSHSSLSGTSASLFKNLSNGSYTYTISTSDKLYSPSPSSSSFTVSGAPLTITITFSLVTYQVTFTESGLPSGVKWFANVSGQASQNSTSSSIALTNKLSNGSYSYSISSSNSNYVDASSPSSFTVNGAPLTVSITFISTITYKITFTESGLPSSTIFYVNVSGFSSLSSTNGTIITRLPNSTYTYTVQTSDKLYSPSPSSSSFTVSGAPLTITITFSLVTYQVTFTESGLPSSTEWYVNVTGQASQSSTSSSIALTNKLSNGSYTYTISTSDKLYSPSPSSSSFTVNGAPLTITITFSLVTYQVTFTESGLPSSTEWYVNVTGQASQSSTTGELILTNSLSNGTYYYSVSSVNPEYVPSLKSSSFTVNGASLTIPLTFSLLTYQVTFVTSDNPSSLKWYVNITGQSSLSTTSSSVSISLSNGSYSFTLATNNKVYRITASSDNFAVSGASEQIQITFSLVTYVVTFTESGLPTGTTWYANVSGQSPLFTTSTSMGISLSNSSYTYTIAVDNKAYTPIPSSSSLIVNGNPQTITITFNLVTYSVTFTESGLPSSTKWYVNVTGQSSQSSTSVSLTLSPNLPNGTYYYGVASGNSKYAISQSTGSFTVSGKAITIALTFYGTSSLFTLTVQSQGLASKVYWSGYIQNLTSQTIYSISTKNFSQTFLLPNGTYSYTINDSLGYAPTVNSGYLTIDNASYVLTVSFYSTTSHILYNVTFTASGLPSGAKWQLTINGNTYVGTTITVTLANQNYSFIAVYSGYSQSPKTSSIFVTSNSSYTVVFTKQQYTGFLAALNGWLMPLGINITILYAIIALLGGLLVGYLLYAKTKNTIIFVAPILVILGIGTVLQIIPIYPFILVLFVSVAGLVLYRIMGSQDNGDASNE